MGKVTDTYFTGLLRKISSGTIDIKHLLSKCLALSKHSVNNSSAIINITVL